MLPNYSLSTGALKPTVSSQNKTRTAPHIRQLTALSNIKKESKLITRNPLQYLESCADRKFAPIPADTTPMVALIKDTDIKTDGYCIDKIRDFQQKCQLSKTRSLLLNLSSNPSIHSKKNRSRVFSGASGDGSYSGASTRTSSTTSVGTSSSRSASVLDEFDYHNEELNRNSLEEVEGAIEMFMDEIKNSEIDNIVVWISTLATLSDFKLPYGLPVNLRMPSNPESVKDPELASFVETASDGFLLLDAEYHGKLEEIITKLKNNYSSTQTSGWSARDSALLFYIMSSIDNTPTISNTLFQEELTRRLFPQYNHEVIIAQKYRLKMKRAWEEKRDNIIKDWMRDKEDLQNKTNSGWDDIQEKKVKKMELVLERKKQKERCKYWKELLENMRKDKRLKVRRIQIMVEPYEKLMEQREVTRMEEEERKRREQKELLEEYKTKRIQKRKQELKDQGILEQQLEMNAKLQAKYNQTRVHVRQFELEKKQEALKELEKLKEEERKLKDALLEKTKEKVEFDYDPSNLLADTHASMVRRYEVRSLYENQEELDMIKFFRERYSFSSECVWKDRRVRLEAKLRDAGLIGSSYARQVLAAMEPKAKPHLHSQIKFDSN